MGLRLIYGQKSTIFNVVNTKFELIKKTETEVIDAIRRHINGNEKPEDIYLICGNLKYENDPPDQVRIESFKNLDTIIDIMSE